MVTLKPRSFKLDQETIDSLKTLATVRNNTLSGTIRELIRHGYEHQILGIPRCASGSPCLVPATWEQHLALRRMAEARAAENHKAETVPDLQLQPIVGQTDIDPNSAFHRPAESFLKNF